MLLARISLKYSIPQDIGWVATCLLVVVSVIGIGLNSGRDLNNPLRDIRNEIFVLCELL